MDTPQQLLDSSSYKQSSDSWAVVLATIWCSAPTKEYSYPLSDDMVDGFTFSKPSLVKCQIITGNIERDVQRRLGSIKQKYFDEIVDKIVESIF